jgi:hypothetical protein
VLPEISHGGTTYRFNFLRLSLVCQSADPVIHFDSDAATALTGDVGSLNEREVLRLLLNRGPPISSRRGSYVRAKDPARLQTRARVALIPPRMGTTVRGLAFSSNRVQHSGVDGEHGHFIAAYGMETADRGGAS